MTWQAAGLCNKPRAQNSANISMVYIWQEYASVNADTTEHGHESPVAIAYFPKTLAAVTPLPSVTTTV